MSMGADHGAVGLVRQDLQEHGVGHATVNDVHFGETVCGRIHTVPDEELGVAIPRPDEPPYPQTMNRAAIAEIAPASAQAPSG